VDGKNRGGRMDGKRRGGWKKNGWERYRRKDLWVGESEMEEEWMGTVEEEGWMGKVEKV
jgi:hypothetical protein